MTHLGGSIDELKSDFFQGRLGSVNVQGLPEHENTLLGANAASLDDEEIVADNAVVGETS